LLAIIKEAGKQNLEETKGRKRLSGGSNQKTSAEEN
jgi:hypothetical protein